MLASDRSILDRNSSTELMPFLHCMNNHIYSTLFRYKKENQTEEAKK